MTIRLSTNWVLMLQFCPQFLSVMKLYSPCYHENGEYILSMLLLLIRMMDCTADPIWNYDMKIWKILKKPKSHRNNANKVRDKSDSCSCYIFYLAMFHAGAVVMLFCFSCFLIQEESLWGDWRMMSNFFKILVTNENKSLSCYSHSDFIRQSLLLIHTQINK